MVGYFRETSSQIHNLRRQSHHKITEPQNLRTIPLPPRIDELRKFYNTTLRPELYRLEQLRKRLARGIYASVAGVVLLVTAFIIYDLGFLIFVVGMPLIFYVGSLYFRIERFRQTFKPAIMQLLMEFLNDAPNYRQLTYEAKTAINRDRFEYSGLFRPMPDTYHAEDYIKGLVGEMAFEMGECYVREISPASNRLETVFSGLFVHAKFSEPTTGQIAVWPRRKLRRLKRTVDAYVSAGGIDADIEVMNAGFREEFATFAKRGTHVAGILTPPMQDALLEFARNQEQEIFFAVNNQDLFIGVAHDYDLLEPSFFKSNMSFALVRKFYLDITLMLSVISDFDQTH
jgi:type IV secretory pathway VirB3-like protein